MTVKKLIYLEQKLKCETVMLLRPFENSSVKYKKMEFYKPIENVNTMKSQALCVRKQKQQHDHVG